MKKPLHLMLCLILIIHVGVSYAQSPSTYLKHKWTFKEDVNDAVGGLAGTLVGGAYALDGLNLSANGDYVEIPGASIAINTYNEVSFEISYTASELKTNCMLYYLGNSTNNFGNDGIFLAPNHWDGPAIRTAISTGTYSDGPWSNETAVKTTATVAGVKYHVVTTVDATNLKLYVDGVLIGSAALSEKNNSLAALSTAYGWIGRGGYTSDPTFLGVIHKFAIYNKALGDDEVVALFNGTSSQDFATENFKPAVYAKNGSVIVSLKETNSKTADLEVYNLAGTKINTTSAFSNETQISLQRGIYMVRVSDGLKSYIQKVSVR